MRTIKNNSLIHGVLNIPKNPFAGLKIGSSQIMQNLIDLVNYKRNVRSSDCEVLKSSHRMSIFGDIRNYFSIMGRKPRSGDNWCITWLASHYVDPFE